VIADLQSADPGPHGFDYSGRLVAAAEGEMAHGYVTRSEVIVGVAQAGSHHADQDLVVAGRIELDVDDLPPPGNLGEYGGSGLHG
jgi:hypothetical protein